MLVGVVVALGLMILRFFFPFYLLCLICISPCCACRDEVRVLNPGEVRGVSFWVRFYTRLSSAVPNPMGYYTSKWSGESWVVGMWFAPKQCLSRFIWRVVWRVLFLRGWKDTLINEGTGWVQEGVQEYPVRFRIDCGVSGSQKVFYIESPSVLKQLLQM